MIFALLSPATGKIFLDADVAPRAPVLGIDAAKHVAPLNFNNSIGLVRAALRRIRGYSWCCCVGLRSGCFARGGFGGTMVWRVDHDVSGNCL